MNIYVVIENQFPDAELIMICCCDNEDQAVIAYRRLWEGTESRISACILISECNATEPRVLWKNFITEDKPINNEQESGQSDEGISEIPSSL